MRTQKVNILVGRFQPITLGHMKCAQNTYKTRGLKTVLCCIDTTKPDERHPFRTSLLWGVYRKMITDSECLEDIVLVKNADLVKIGEALGQKGYSIETWTCGTDRYADYKRMCTKYAPDVEVIEVHREDKDVSATEVRQAIAADHRDRFEELTPPAIHKLYPKLREALNSIEPSK